MHLGRQSSVKGWVAVAASLALIASCQAVPAAAPSAPAKPMAGASFAIDASGVMNLLATKPTTNWQDTMFTMPALQERRQARGYHVKASNGSLSASVNLGAGASSSGLAYYHTWPDWPGPAPQATDAVFVVSDSGTLYKLNATTLATLSSRSGLGAFNGGAVLLSSDGKDVYLLTTAGQLLVLDANTLATRATATLTGTGFSKTAPTIDYATSTVGNGSHDDIWVVANDGGITRVVVDTAAGTVLSNTGWSAASIGYGGAVSVSAFPFVWAREAYFGASSGTFYHVDLNGTPAVQKWSLTGNTSATGTTAGITAPCTVDFDPNTFAVNAVFVPCGDRLNWIDPINNTVTPSGSLTVDKGSTLQGSLATYAPTSSTTLSYTSTDYISIKKQVTSPSRWGGSLGSQYNTGTMGTSVKYSANGASGAGEVWTANNAAGTASRLNLGGTVINSYAAPGGSPNEVCVDGAGNMWVTTAGRIVKFSPSGAVLANTALTNALWPEVDPSNNVWVTSQSGTINKYNSTGALQFSKNIGGAFSVTTDTAGDAWVTSSSANRVYKVSPTGTVGTGIAVGAFPAYITKDPLTGNLWTANASARTISVINPTTGVVIQTITGLPAGLWAVNFDDAGNPWTCHLVSGGTSQVNQLDRTTGAIVANYNMTPYGNCYEMCFDPSGTGWVATDQGVIRILNLGNLQDLFGADYYLTPSDADDSYGFVKFKIPRNAFANQVPVSANLTLTANSTEATPDNFSVYEADVNHSGGALWTGYPGTPNVDYNNRPAVNSWPFFNNPSLSAVQNTAYAFGLPGVLSDQLNSADTTNSQYAYAFRSAGKALGQVAHWYSNLSAGATTSKYPTLNIKLDTAAKLPTTGGIACQPSVDGYGHVYVMSTNALWQLDYSSQQAFQDPAKTIFTMSQTGRTAGQGPLVNTTTPKTYVFPSGNVLLLPNGRAVGADFNPANTHMVLNDFITPLSATSDKLSYQVDVAPAQGALCRQMLWDFVGGNAYLTTTSGHVIRANILQ